MRHVEEGCLDAHQAIGHRDEFLAERRQLLQAFVQAEILESVDADLDPQERAELLTRARHEALAVEAEHVMSMVELLQHSRETTSMKAFILDRYGSAGRVHVGDMPDPQLREDDPLVQVHAAGVNLLDSKIRNGEFKLILRYGLPLILGHDAAGVVVRVGARVRRFKPGDEVYARPADGRIGAFAEFIRSKKMTWRLNPKHSPWKKRSPSPWSAWLHSTLADSAHRGLIGVRKNF